MGDLRFGRLHERLHQSADPAGEIRGLPDEEVVAALAGAVGGSDPYLANVLATEALNRLRRASALASNIGEGVCAVDRAGRITLVNPVAERLLGWSALELLGADLHETAQCYCPGAPDGSPPSCPVQAVLAGRREPWCGDGTCETAEGRVLQVSYAVGAISEDGRSLGAVMTFRDITRRKHQEGEMEAVRARLAESEAWFRSAFDGAGSGMAVCDTSGRFLQVNPAFCRLTGYTEEELLARDWQSLTHPDDLKASLDEVRNLLSEAIPSIHMEKRYLTKRGETIWAEANVTLIRTGPRGPTQMLAQVQDISARVLAERDLQRREAQLVEAERIARFGSWQWDIKENEVWWSRGLYAIFGVDRAGFGATFEAYLSFVHPEDRERVRQDVEWALKTRSSFRHVARICRSDGDVRWLSSRGECLFDDRSEVTAMVGVCHDVTERAEAEAALRETTARLNTILDTVAEGIVLLDTDGWMVYANASAERILGAPRSAILERRYDDPAWQLVGPPEEAAAREERFRHLIEGEGPVYATVGLLHPDGKQVQVALTGNPLRGADGRTKGVVISLTDVTDKARAEEALRRSEEQYRRLVEHAPMPIGVHREGRLVYVNEAAARLVGASTREELIGKSVLDFVLPEDRDLVLSRIRALLETRQPQEATEERLIRLDGEVLTVEVSGIPVTFEGEPAIQVILQDVTERKRAEEEARRLNEDLERRVRERTRQLEAANEGLASFNYTVSHDLRAPLRGIAYFSEVLEQEYSDRLDEEGRRHLLRLREEAQRMGELIRDLLDLSQVTRGHVRQERVNLTALAREIAGDLASREPSRRVVFNIAPSLEVQGDPRLLAVALENLLGNAWKFTSRVPEARIEVGVQPQPGGGRVFFVRDNGAGFDMARAGRLFQPFTRLHGREFEGTGVGLATVKRIIERHGGRVWAEGRVGEGATFFFTIPDGA